MLSRREEFDIDISLPLLEMKVKRWLDFLQKLENKTDQELELIDKLEKVIYNK